MIEIMCEDRYGELHHAGILAEDVPQFRTMRQAEKWCEEQNWKGNGRDGRRYELCVHEVVGG